jgi:D-amino-acid oxidase
VVAPLPQGTQPGPSRMSSADVLVIGAGVAGLTTAVCLAEAGAHVRVVAKERPEHTTSAAAGAVWAPYRIGGDPARIDRWSQRSLAVFTALARSEDAGVRLLTSMEVSRRPVAAPEWAPLIPGVRACTADELPAGYAYGYRFVIPAIDMPIYLAFLLARLENAGGILKQDTVTSLETVSGRAAAVVNCTGMGARELVHDPTLRPVRGQLVVVANPGVEVGLVEAEDDPDSTELTFLIPHGATLVLGGTAEPDDERTDPDPDTTRAILARCARLDPRFAGAHILAERVGFRPERPEVRVAAERCGDARVWHNYGHGGAGVTLSWGCAEEITASVLATLDGGSSTAGA